mgnify:CR=1 FL=1
MNDHQRYTEVEILDVSTRDSKDWVGLTTKNHGELRCKSNLRTKLKLKKDWKGDLTVWINPSNQTVCVAFDQKAHIVNGVNALPTGQWSLDKLHNSKEIKVYKIFISFVVFNIFFNDLCFFWFIH